MAVFPAVGHAGHNHMLAYTPVPSSAFRIDEPDLALSPSSSDNPLSANFPPAAKRSRLASFPPNVVPVKELTVDKGVKKGLPGFGGKDGAAGTGGGLGSALSSGVTDMFLSSLLPSTLPSKASPGAPLPAPAMGKIRVLSSQRETLALPAMTNNFRRFVARCGTIFWVEDRVEEVMYWRKPIWTWSWMLLWGFISFYPRILLLIPFCVLILILLHQHSKTHPSLHPSLTSSASPNPLPPSRSILANPLAATLAATLTNNSDPSVNAKARPDVVTEEKDGEGHASTGAADGSGKEVQTVPGGPAESGVDYYLNLQGIQNFMGLFSDVHDAVLPYISLVIPSMPSPSPPPTTFPLSSTHIMILLLPPAIFLPVIPASLLPYLLLPVGILPPILYHPAIPSLIERFRTWEGISQRKVRYWRGVAERWVLTDRLDDSIARSEIREVRVWENQRLDLNWAPGKTKPTDKEKKEQVIFGKTPDEPELPPSSAWSSLHLKGSERMPWVRVLPKRLGDSLWQDEPVMSPRSPDPNDGKRSSSAERQGSGKVALSLVEGWSFVPGEEWRVDYVAEWDRRGGDDNGWVYTDDEWKRSTATPLTGTAIGSITPNMYQMTRRRQWWRRAYSTK